MDALKTVIAGSRKIHDLGLVTDCIEMSFYNISRVLSGGCSGVDLLGEVWARNRGIEVSRYNANWNQYGRAAGPIRNRQMADDCEAAIIVMAEGNHGSIDMLRNVHRVGVPACIYLIEEGRVIARVVLPLKHGTIEGRHPFVKQVLELCRSRTHPDVEFDQRPRLI